MFNDWINELAKALADGKRVHFLDINDKLLMNTKTSTADLPVSS